MNNTNNSSKSKVASVQCERSNTAWGIYKHCLNSITSLHCTTQHSGSWLPRYDNTYYQNIANNLC